MQTIALEFRHENGALAANGSDVVTFLDGRWNNASKVDHIWAKIAELRSGPFASRYQKQHFVGYTRLGENWQYTRLPEPQPQVAMSDPEPPAWVPRLEGSKF